MIKAIQANTCVGSCLYADDSAACFKCAPTTFYITMNTMWTMIHSNTSHCLSPPIWYIIHRDLSEISIVSSWALTDVFHCEYQPRCHWISPFSSILVTNSYRALWCQSQSVALIWVSVAEYLIDWKVTYDPVYISGSWTKWLSIYIHKLGYKLH